MKNIHATCIALNNKGVLLLGDSGSGKSDLALRLIEQLGAVLVADDRTDLAARQNRLFAACPANLQGLLEVRGVGIVRLPCQTETEVCLAVELAPSPQTVERLPEPAFWAFDNLKIKKIRLYPFEPSAVFKIKLACDENLQVS